jgi:hypothetical protein
MKSRSLASLSGAVLFIAGSVQSPAYALTTTTGNVVAVYADPSDVVVELDKAGSCGSRYFHIQRSSTNFKELTVFALTGFSNRRPVTFFVGSCYTDRNVVDHGAVIRG